MQESISKPGSKIAVLHQARNQLGTPGGAKSFLRGAQIFWTMFNSFKLCPTHFSRGGEKFSRRCFAHPGYGPVLHWFQPTVLWFFQLVEMFFKIEFITIGIGGRWWHWNEFFVFLVLIKSMYLQSQMAVGFSCSDLLIITAYLWVSPSSCTEDRNKHQQNVFLEQVCFSPGPLQRFFHAFHHTAELVLWQPPEQTFPFFKKCWKLNLLPTSL